MKKRILSLLQLALGIGLMAFILAKMNERGDLGKLGTALIASAANWQFLCAGVFLFLACMLLCSLRWQLLMRANGVSLSFLRTVELYFIGHFFSSFMLGSTGGDLVKAYYVSKVTTHKKTEVVSTVFIDRIIGMFVLISLMLTMTVIRLDFFMQKSETKALVAMSALIFVGLVFGMLMVFRQDLFEKSAIFRKIEERTRFGGMIKRVSEAFRVCLAHRGLMINSLVLSLINHISLIAAAFCFGMALSVDLTFWSYLTILPVISTVSAIPLTPGGLGTREGTSILMFGLLGVPDTTALLISLMLYAGMTMWAMIGGIVYVAYSQRAGRISGNEAEALKDS